MILALAFILGIVAGLRAMTAPAAASWAAKLGLLNLAGTPLAFLGYHYTAYIFTLFAIGELITDKLPKTPSRKVPMQFITRVVSGALVGAAIGIAAHQLIVGLVLGAVGAVVGTLGGSAVRGRLASLFGKDLPAALLEDVVAIILAVVVVTRLG
ncbi:DUF4126 family protein [Granulicella arctica]|uniref:DUF4126 family protein n=1 Tax=Granulicella arctica TaxID=940613 RepID=UPI0021E0F32B|nr:DUF4126 family protein [Granulicella arctica]